jgi:hypothetical protein
LVSVIIGTIIRRALEDAGEHRSERWGGGRDDGDVDFYLRPEENL